MLLAVEGPSGFTLKHRVESLESLHLASCLRVAHFDYHRRILQHLFERVLEAGRRVNQHKFAFVLQQCLHLGLHALRCLLEHVLVELVFHEARRCDENALNDVEIHVPEDALHHRLVELREALKIAIHTLTLAEARQGPAHLFMLRRHVFPLPWNRHVNLAPNDCHIRCDEANVCNSFLHDDRSDVGVLRYITGRIDATQRD